MENVYFRHLGYPGARSRRPIEAEFLWTLRTSASIGVCWVGLSSVVAHAKRWTHSTTDRDEDESQDRTERTEAVRQVMLSSWRLIRRRFLCALSISRA